jgi:plastocyanin
MKRQLAGFYAAVTLAIGINAGAAGVVEADLVGTARAGAHPEINAVVWLEMANATPSTPKQNAVLHQRSLMFAPHVLAVRVGTTVDFPNEDRVFHNVFSFKDGKQFDLGLYPIGSLKRVLFSDAGVSRLFCNIHPHMAGYVVAVDSPYFSAVDEKGAFTIPAVPSGPYTYRAWRPAGPILTGTLVIGAASRLDLVWP